MYYFHTSNIFQLGITQGKILTDYIGEKLLEQNKEKYFS